MRRRSPQEIAFRLKQEFRNLSLWLRPPAPPLPRNLIVTFLPDPAAVADAIRDTPAAVAMIAVAGQILAHRLPVLGLTIDTGSAIRWRRDYVSGKEPPAAYFRRIPYLDAARAGDHKVIWELNRHQHLVVLAQVFRLTGQAEFPREVARQLESWFEANPFQCGINWASALEVAFRALSWIWVLHLCGDALGGAVRTRLLTGLYHHGLHLACNLSYYFSPNTHLLGEGVALHALGILFREVAGAESWESLGAEVVNQEFERQVRPDGSHFEQSSYYHVYALDMFLFHAILAGQVETYLPKLDAMAEYLDALMGPGRSLPFIGDDDGGRFFYPYGDRERFGRATLATCGAVLRRPEWIREDTDLYEQDDLYEQAVWWLGPQILDRDRVSHRAARESRLFGDSGTAVMVNGDVSVIIDAGPFGPFRSGHSHADTLSLVARKGESDLLIDPGTFTYVGDPHWRQVFRGTAAHNTIRIAGLDQGDPAGPFAWNNPPRVALTQWESNSAADYLGAECRYRGCVHRRRVLFLKPDLLFILDEVSGGAAEQFWHPGAPAEMVNPGCFRIGDAGTLLLDDSGPAELTYGGEFGWRSRVFGVKEPAPVIVKRGNRRFGAVLALSAPKQSATLTIQVSEGGVHLVLTGAWEQRVWFPVAGTPSVS